MCGIVGCLLTRPLTADDINRLRILRDGLTHRGPDDAGEFVDAPAGLYLGHRRLSIIDLDPRSAQPMTRDNATIVFNGEIYNYKDLRAQLSPEYSFTTEGDTEIILRAWQKQGSACLDLFDGMYAFALRDAQGLHLVTDPFGEKPLYLLQRPEGVYFASEPAPLIRAFNLTFAPSEAEWADFFYLGYIRPPATGYAGLRALPPAAILSLTPDGTQRQRTYWTPPAPHIGHGKVHDLTVGEIDSVRDILCRSLERRLHADVPVGLFLSGGVDSALVAALAARELGVDLKTYTVSFPDGEDESTTAQAIAAHLNLPHTIIDSREADLWRTAPQTLARLYGVPNDNMTALAVWQMCAAAKKILTVAISGLGGDEVFYGYNKYETLYRRRHFYRHPHLCGLLARLGKRIGHAQSARLDFLLRGDDDRRYLCVKTGAPMAELEALFPQRPAHILPPGPADLAHRVRQFDMASSMPQSYIPAIDRGSMREGVEVRTPFLNRTLVDAVYALDQRRLIAHGKKAMTRELLARYMPLSLLYHKKQGFVFPATRYYREMNPPAPALSFLDPEKIRVIWDKKAQAEVQALTLRLSLAEEFLRGAP